MAVTYINGERVAVKQSDGDWLVGTVIDSTKSTCLFDNGKTGKMGKTVLTKSLKTMKKPLTLSQLSAFVLDEKWFSFIVNTKKNLAWDSTGVKAVWHTINAKFFDGALTLPTIKLTTHRNVMGFYRADTNTIGVNPNMVVSLQKLTEVVAHEMVHQYNHAIDKKPKETNRHGLCFTRWIPIFNAKGIIVSIIDDGSDTDTELEQGKSVEPFHVLLTRWTPSRSSFIGTPDRWYGGIIDPKLMWRMLAKARLTKDNFSTVYICNDAKIKANLKNFNGVIDNKFRIAVNIVELISRTGKPVQGQKQIPNIEVSHDCSCC